MIVKKHINNNRLILAACDSSLLNKKIEDKNSVLDLTSNFYKGASINKSEFINLINKAYIINAVGSECTKILIDEGIITKKETKEIKGVPYIQLVFEQN